MLLILVVSSIFNVFLGLYVSHKTKGDDTVGVILVVAGIIGLMFWFFLPEVVVVIGFSITQLLTLNLFWLCGLGAGFFVMVRKNFFLRVEKQYWKESVIVTMICFIIFFVIRFGGFNIVTINVLLNVCEIFFSSLQIGQTYNRTYSVIVKIAVSACFCSSFVILISMGIRVLLSLFG